MTPTRQTRALTCAAVALLAGCAAALLATPAGAATGFLDLDYDLDSPPAPSRENRLDLYLPDGASSADSRPVVVYVHGGGWSIGDKRNAIASKVDLFTGAGYVFASVNYRLSPDPPSTDPDRVMFPDHPHDVGEAIGWLDRNVSAYGGDPERIVLIGHSAGAHLVSLIATDPSYVEAYGVEPWQLVGAVPLDTAGFDVAGRIAELGPVGRQLYTNAFGTTAENAATGSWAQASPITWADSADPEQLMVTQAASSERVQENRSMASALGQDPAGVVLVPYDHAGINAAVGASDDPAGETAAIMAFMARVIAAAKPPRTRLERRPPKRVGTTHRKARVRFRFTSKDPEASFECRLDRRSFKRCRSPRKLIVGRGKHRFRVRAIAAGGRPGPVESFRFRVRRARGQVD